MAPKYGPVNRFRKGNDGVFYMLSDDDGDDVVLVSSSAVGASNAEAAPQSHTGMKRKRTQIIDISSSGTSSEDDDVEVAASILPAKGKGRAVEPAANLSRPGRDALSGKTMADALPLKRPRTDSASGSRLPVPPEQVTKTSRPPSRRSTLALAVKDGLPSSASSSASLSKSVPSTPRIGASAASANGGSIRFQVEGRGPTAGSDARVSSSVAAKCRVISGHPPSVQRVKSGPQGVSASATKSTEDPTTPRPERLKAAAMRAPKKCIRPDDRAPSPPPALSIQETSMPYKPQQTSPQTSSSVSGSSDSTPRPPKSGTTALVPATAPILAETSTATLEPPEAKQCSEDDQFLFRLHVVRHKAGAQPSLTAPLSASGPMSNLPSCASGVLAVGGKARVKSNDSSPMATLRGRKASQDKGPGAALRGGAAADLRKMGESVAVATERDHTLASVDLAGNALSSDEETTATGMAALGGVDMDMVVNPLVKQSSSAPARLGLSLTDEPVSSSTAGHGQPVFASIKTKSRGSKLGVSSVDARKKSGSDHTAIQPRATPTKVDKLQNTPTDRDKSNLSTNDDNTSAPDSARLLSKVSTSADEHIARLSSQYQTMETVATKEGSFSEPTAQDAPEPAALILGLRESATIHEDINRATTDAFDALDPPLAPRTDLTEAVPVTPVRNLIVHTAFALPENNMPRWTPINAIDSRPRRDILPSRGTTTATKSHTLNSAKIVSSNRRVTESSPKFSPIPSTLRARTELASDAESGSESAGQMPPCSIAVSPKDGEKVEAIPAIAEVNETCVTVSSPSSRTQHQASLEPTTVLAPSVCGSPPGLLAAFLDQADSDKGETKAAEEAPQTSLTDASSHATAEAPTRQLNEIEALEVTQAVVHGLLSPIAPAQAPARQGLPALERDTRSAPPIAASPSPVPNPAAIELPAIEPAAPETAALVLSAPTGSSGSNTVSLAYGRRLPSLPLPALVQTIEIPDSDDEQETLADARKKKKKCNDNPQDASVLPSALSYLRLPFCERPLTGPERPDEFDTSPQKDWLRTRSPNDPRYFEDIVGESERRECSAPPYLKVTGTAAEPMPPLEFVYTNRIIYRTTETPHKPKWSCGCVGDCAENPDCACRKWQERMSAGLWLGGGSPPAGFAWERRNGSDTPTLRRAWVTDQYPVFECNSWCSCDKSCCINSTISRGRHLPLSLQLTLTCGWGVFAEEKIRTGDFIAVYSGELITVEEMDRRAPYYDFLGRTYQFELDPWFCGHVPGAADFDSEGILCLEHTEAFIPAAEAPTYHGIYGIDAFHYGNITRFCNHSCDPNVAIVPIYIDEGDYTRPTFAFVAKRAIKRNEEVKVAYSSPPDTVDENQGGSEEPKEQTVGSRGNKVVPCMCGTKKCHGFMFA